MNSKFYKSIQRRFGQVAECSNGELRVNCPFCYIKKRKQDTELKMYLNITKNVYNCFRCGTAGLLNQLIPQLISYDQTYGASTSFTKQTDLESLPEIVPLNALEQDHVAKLYLDERGYSHLRESGDIFFTSNYVRSRISYGARIVFPIYQSGTYRGFQARSIENKLPKYLTALGSLKKRIIYNWDEANKQHERLIIVEGIFDCLKLPLDSVALLGKHLTDDQYRILCLGSWNRVLVFLDKDALPESKSIAKKLSSCYNTYIVNTPFKDLGEIPTQDVDKYLKNPYLERVY